MAALTAGVTAPRFTLKTMEGKSFSLEEALRRGPVVLAFFKVSCPVCQYALPFLERMFLGYKGTGATFVAVSQNSQKDTAAFLKEFGVTFTTALDDPARYAVSNAYQLTNVPTVFYIAPDGHIEVSGVGWSRAEIADINIRLAEHLKAKQAPLFRTGEDVAEWKAG